MCFVLNLLDVKLYLKIFYQLSVRKTKAFISITITYNYHIISDYDLHPHIKHYQYHFLFDQGVKLK